MIPLSYLVEVPISQWADKITEKKEQFIEDCNHISHDKFLNIIITGLHGQSDFNIKQLIAGKQITHFKSSAYGIKENWVVDIHKKYFPNIDEFVSKYYDKELPQKIHALMQDPKTAVENLRKSTF